MKKLLVLLAMTLAGNCASAAEGGFLFSTFKDETTPLSEQIYFAFSEDGKQWESLNGGRPVLVSDVGEKGVRDSFLLRSHDGQKVWLIATDLCVNRNRDWQRNTHAGSRSLVVWESDDLVHWSRPRLAKVGPDDAGCVWAPEAIYDEESGDYLVYWASTTSRDNFSKQRIWAAHTKDFRSFDKPFIYVEKANHVIDIDIAHYGNTYYRFTKDDRTKSVHMETSKKLTGQWQEMPQFKSGRGKNFEGPICYRLKAAVNGQPPKWCLLLDDVSDRIGAGAFGYVPFISDDLSTGRFTLATDFHFPFPFRHGSVLPITTAERERLESAYPGSAPAAAATGRSIKDAYKDLFLIGMAGDLPRNYSNQELSLVKDNFNVVTPENCMKPANIHPQADTWRFEQADALVKWCGDNHIAVHGHTLVWHAQTNDWFFRDGDKATVTRRLNDHIQTLVGRYKGKMRGWDVVNEAINDFGNAQTENLRNSSWLRVLGPEYLTLAFKFAHEADPDAKLYYNDYGIESGAEHASSMLLLHRLLKERAPVHGVGIQGHWSTGHIPYAELDKAISDYSSLGLKVSITELDVTIRGESGGQFGMGRRRFGGPPPAPPAAQDLKAQADAYARLFSIFIKHKSALERVTFWGLSDRRTWRYGQHPLLFDADNQRKPAYAAIVEAIDHPKMP